MSALSMLAMGFKQCMDPQILLLCLFGAVIGTMVGVLPGFGPAACLAVLLPVVYGRDPLSSLVLLAGIFSGAMFGGMITSINLNIPGENASIVTTFDGHPLAKKGKAGVAMGVAAISSFVGGTIGVVLLSLLGQPLANIALAFGPSEYLSIYLFTFIAVVTIGGKSFVASSISLIFGLLMSVVGLDVISGSPRLTFGSVNLMAGIDFLPAVIGLFGLSEVVISLLEGERVTITKEQIKKFKLKEVFPSIKQLIHCIPTWLRSSPIGFSVGSLPGAGATIATFLSYGMEKRLAKDPETFGKGNIRGVAAAEATNNGSAMGSYVPLLALGIPGSATTAVLLGAFVLVGITPGPLLFREHPDLVWGLIASMYLGNVALLLINTAFIPLFLWLLRISEKTMPVIVATLCFIGTFSNQNLVSDILIMLLFTFIGVFFKKLDIPPAPCIIALVLGGDLEFSLRQTLELFQGNFLLCFTKPITTMFFVVGALLILNVMIKSIKSRKANANTM
ncbi:MAG: tripartite tricarboxylate transporter permease [Peptococcaceae bacterium]